MAWLIQQCHARGYYDPIEETMFATFALMRRPKMFGNKIVTAIAISMIPRITIYSVMPLALYGSCVVYVHMILLDSETLRGFGDARAYYKYTPYMLHPCYAF